MRVCFVSYPALQLLKGGPITQILETKMALEKLFVEVELYNMWEKIELRKYDLVHIFGSGIANFHLAREIKKIGIKTVLSPIFFSTHSKYFIKNVLRFDRIFLRKFRGLWSDYRFVKDMCDWADAILPNTKKEAELIKSAFNIDEGKMFIVPNGVNERFYYSKPDQFIEKYNVKSFILNVGHVGPGRKNILRLVKALNMIDKEAVIIGRIEIGKEYEKIKSVISNKILIIDNIPNDSELLSSAYAACDVFVLPSLFETPGIAALEAALAGAKIVITKYGGTYEYFQNHAEYVDPYSVKSIVDGIKKALEKPKSNILQNYIKSNFTWDVVGQKTKEVYEKILLV